MESNIKKDLHLLLENPRGLCLEKSIKKRYPKEYPIILKYNGFSWSEKLYNYIYDYPDHICPICGNPIKFISFIEEYRQFCGVRCMSKATYDKKNRYHEKTLWIYKKYANS